jgi:hypothetical protein
MTELFPNSVKMYSNIATRIVIFKVNGFSEGYHSH